MKKISEEEHKQLATWAADCATHVLAVFEKQIANDVRPRKALESIYAWIRGEMKVGEVRKSALAAHAAARETENDKAKAAARAAGHATATAHVPAHAKHAAAYALKASNNKKRKRVAD